MQQPHRFYTPTSSNDSLLIRKEFEPETGAFGKITSLAFYAYLQR